MSESVCMCVCKYVCVDERKFVRAREKRGGKERDRERERACACVRVFVYVRVCARVCVHVCLRYV